MKNTAEFINEHNVLGIVEDLMCQPLDNFHHGWKGLVESLAQACWSVLKRYNQRLQNNGTLEAGSDVSIQKRSKQELERLTSFAQSLWRTLTPPAQENLWLEWLKLGLVKKNPNPTDAIVLDEAVNA